MAAPSRADRLRVWPQYLLPHKLLTALAHRLSNSTRGWIRRPLIGWFQRRFGVNLEEAESARVDDYPSFDAFFTRALRPGARPLAPGRVPVCPCDGIVSQLGELDGCRLIQAKGMDYSADELLGSKDLARPFAGGRFLTTYLAPADYHRVHMPVDGRLMTEVRIPGRLFSVSAATTRSVPRLFVRNERMAAVFETEFGPLAVVMVAALLVAGIETVWQPGGPHRPGAQPRRNDPDRPIELARGAELGRFHWGSTVILLATGRFPRWSGRLAPEGRVRLGMPLCRED